MMLKQGLEVKLGQGLSLTPQMQQAIRLLQLSTQDLHLEIGEVILSNPMLEYAEEGLDSNSVSSDVEDITYTGDQESLSEYIPSDMSADANWQEVYPDVGDSLAGEQNATNPLEIMNAHTESLTDHLLWQVSLSSLGAIDKLIAQTLIASINDEGYLDESLETIVGMLDSDLLIELDEVEAILHYIQSLEPVGVGARTLQECLTLQIKHLHSSHPLAGAAMCLLEQHTALLEKKDYQSIKRTLQLDDEQYLDLIHLLRSLNATPGEAIGGKVADYITPEVFVFKDQAGEWAVTLNHAVIPALQINSHYESLLDNNNDKVTKKYLKSHLDQAEWFMKALHHRGNTVLDVSAMIVKKQKAFLRYGEVAMKPMLLKDLAEELGVNESTISRVTSNKYIHTPRGVFELKYFFSNPIGTQSGGECASTAIRAMIQKLVDKENIKKPLSDDKLATMLKGQGINIARRTVTKYREALAIPSSRERKSLA